MTVRKELLERLNAGESVLHASGYLFEMERRGYLQANGCVTGLFWLLHTMAIIKIRFSCVKIFGVCSVLLKYKVCFFKGYM